MENIAAAFWGAFFGTAVLMFLASLFAFARSQRRVALMAALSSVVSALFVAAYIGWLPIGEEEDHARVLSQIAIVSAVVLALMLLSMLGWMRSRRLAMLYVATLLSTGAGVLVGGWFLAAPHALVMSSAVALLVGTAMLLVALRSAVRGDRLAWVAVSGVSLMLGALVGLTWIAMEREVPWPVHAASAVAAMAYLSVMAGALWARYSYLLELSEVMRQGPAYDPVTRMLSHSETSQLLNKVFVREHGEVRVIGIIVISIANLYALENLHGRAAFNHALFICASRLRRCVPAGIAMGRLAEDGFLLLLRETDDPSLLVDLARSIRERLTRPVSLSTRRDTGALDPRQTEWRAELGIGVLSANPHARPTQAVAMVRAMSRTAWTYASRMAWFDDLAGQIAELPVQDHA